MDNPILIVGILAFIIICSCVYILFGFGGYYYMSKSSSEESSETPLEPSSKSPSKTPSKTPSTTGSGSSTTGSGPSTTESTPEQASTPAPVGTGSSCNTHADCQGWLAGKPGTLACCSGKCTAQLADWAGVGYCPADCLSAPAGTIGAQGTCGKYHWPRLTNEPCGLHTDCKGWGPGPTDMACCNGKCTQKLKDWAGVGYCPAECMSGPAGVPNSQGTCDKYHWPRQSTEPCANHTDCAGYGPGPTDMACCQGTCQQKKKDWAGVGYCPNECVGSFAGKPGTC